MIGVEQINALCEAVEHALTGTIDAHLTLAEDGTLQVAATADGRKLVRAVIDAGWRPPAGAHDQAIRAVAGCAVDYYYRTVIEQEDAAEQWTDLCEAVERLHALEEAAS